jgi:hypothetical protein
MSRQAEIAMRTTPAPSLSDLPVDLQTTIEMRCVIYQTAGDLAGHRNCIRNAVALVRR